MIVLALNAGSSSLKFGLYRASAAEAACLLSGQSDSLEAIVRSLDSGGLPAVDAVGHRIVHGGPRLRRPCVADDAALRELDAAAAFAPLHAPAARALVAEALARFPHRPQVLCFDTGFHEGLPDAARVLPVSRELREEGVQRYGFHGLSCESIVRRLGAALPARLVIAHLGSGASVTAVHEGRSVDTSMGLTPAGGLIMGTRTGDVDPGLLVHLMRTRSLDAAAIERLVNHEGGLLAVSGVSGDMRRLREAAPASPGARLAIAMFCRAACKQVAAMITVLGGLDLLVFTGGIGENDAATRSAICEGLAWFGISQDPVLSRCDVRVMPSLEEEQIARHAWSLLSEGALPPG
ncbi:putative propionate kinase [Usitatibacter rugosus]|uniref:Acetate kinase n=1 Tax=Usitatibacter rugosus TaxID=2732067 RepID=A0A6M4GX93_9PROT|nr:acetate kinase [Usitatibacter rugosus]QJR11909.1 putative propionate kinase [Usitatibacter rugosus]